MKRWPLIVASGAILAGTTVFVWNQPSPRQATNATNQTQPVIDYSSLSLEERIEVQDKTTTPMLEQEVSQQNASTQSTPQGPCQNNNPTIDRLRHYFEVGLEEFVNNPSALAYFFHDLKQLIDLNSLRNNTYTVTFAGSNQQNRYPVELSAYITDDELSLYFRPRILGSEVGELRFEMTQPTERHIAQYIGQVQYASTLPIRQEGLSQTLNTALTIRYSDTGEPQMIYRSWMSTYDPATEKWKFIEDTLTPPEIVNVDPFLLDPSGPLDIRVLTSRYVPQPEEP